MKCKTCNQPTIYFGCRWMGAKKNTEKTFWWCFDCGLTVLRFSPHNTIKQCYTHEDQIKWACMARERKIEHLRSMDFGDSIRSLDRKVITMYAWVVARLECSKHPPTMQMVNRVLFNWGMRPLMIEDIDPRMRMDNQYFAYATYLDKVHKFLGRGILNPSVDDINEVDWFDQVVEDKLSEEEAEDAARKKYFMSLIVPKEYRERWANDRANLMKELEEKKYVQKGRGFKKERRSR